MLAAGIAGATALGLCSAQAEDFHIESSIYSGKETKPISQNTTIFRAGIVFDYLSDKTAAVFDKPRDRILLLDPKRKVKAEVKIEELKRFCDDLQEKAAKEGNAYVKFLANPQFDISLDDKTAELVFKSPYLTYRISTIKAESEEAALQYREFSDWYARLNAMTNHMPPFARLAVNEELYRRGLVATQVQLNIPQQILRQRPRRLAAQRTSDQVEAAQARLGPGDRDPRPARHLHAGQPGKIPGSDRFKAVTVSKR